MYHREEPNVDPEVCRAIIKAMRIPLRRRGESYRPTDFMHTRDICRPLLVDRFPGDWTGCSLMIVFADGGRIDPHCDENMKLVTWVRRHLVLQTNPEALATHDGYQQHLELGGVYQMDPRVEHSSVNHGMTDRIHLYVDQHV